MSEIKDTQQHPKIEIAVKNFGPIAEADIDLRPLTVFVGPSNTGKTYFATLIYTLHSIFGEFSYFLKEVDATKRRKPSLNHDTVEAAFKRCFDVKSISDLTRFCDKDRASLEVLPIFRYKAQFFRFGM